MANEKPIIIGTRGSALALAQANMILAQCREAVPDQTFDLQIIKTTGDKLQTASLANPDKSLPKGLFTKELEVALLDGTIDFAVHSLKDLPTELPEGLILGGVTEREDVRDVLVHRAEHGKITEILDIPDEAIIGTSSTRRASQLKEKRDDLQIVEIRGNVGTRLRKVAEDKKLFGTLLAAAGLKRLGFSIGANGELMGEGVPDGIRAVPLQTGDMLPAVGQAAIGIETRADDDRIAAVCAKLIHRETLLSVIAERAFLRAFGGGCSTPVAALAHVSDDQINMQVVSYTGEIPRRAGGAMPLESPIELGEELAAQVRREDDSALN
ncbi:MAG: hydroxymethylbilane synthase [Limisphaerales bacterium]